MAENPSYDVVAKKTFMITMAGAALFIGAVFIFIL